MNPTTLSVYPLADLQDRALARATALVAAVLRGGATIVQLRYKGEQVSRLLRLAQQVRPWLREAGVPLIINDRLDVALATGAEGVHLGQRDTPAAEVLAAARCAGRDDLIVGVSVTTPAQAQRAAAAGAAYLSVSPVFGTATKPDIDPPVGLEGLRRIRQAVPSLPLVAIGGIWPVHVPALLAAGADGVAFISAAGRAPEAGARAMADAVRASHAPRPQNPVEVPR